MKSICYIFIPFLLLLSSAISQCNAYSYSKNCDDGIVETERLQSSPNNCLGSVSQINDKNDSPDTHRFSTSEKLNLDIDLVSMQVGWLWLWILLAGLVFAVGGSLFNRYRQLLSKQQELSAELEGLKEKLVMQSLNTCSPAKEAPQIYRERIENAINSRLGESAWRILNLIVNNPAITNKEIAAEVNLSLDGVSSSLRRMYATFGVGGAGNKKIILAQKAMDIIASSNSEVAKNE